MQHTAMSQAASALFAWNYRDRLPFVTWFLKPERLRLIVKSKPSMTLGNILFKLRYMGHPLVRSIQSSPSSPLLVRMRRTLCEINTESITQLSSFLCLRSVSRVPWRSQIYRLRQCPRPDLHLQAMTLTTFYPAWLALLAIS